MHIFWYVQECDNTFVALKKYEYNTGNQHYSVMKAQHFKTFQFQSYDFRPKNARGTNWSDKGDLNDNEYEHTDIFWKQMTSYSCSTDKMALIWQISFCSQTAKLWVTPDPAKRGNESDWWWRRMMILVTFRATERHGSLCSYQCGNSGGVHWSVSCRHQHRLQNNRRESVIVQGMRMGTGEE